MEFNPTEENKVNIEKRILDLKALKRSYVNEKEVAQKRSGELRDEVSQYQRRPDTHEDFGGLIEERRKVKDDLTAIDLKIKNVNLEIKEKNRLLLEVSDHIRSSKANAKETAKVIESIKELKSKYNEFASDHTRVNSMRIMANKFVDELEELLNELE